MAITARVLFGSPHDHLNTVLERHLNQCRSVQIVSGFATVEGIRWLLPTLGNNPAKLKRLILGAGTQRAFDTLDSLLKVGVDKAGLRIHLGHCRESKGKKPFYQYHPMLHSKIYFFDVGNGQSVSIIGSHNLTGFALTGLNGEAAVELEGESNNVEMRKVQEHLDRCGAESIEYNANYKDAYAWWMHEFLKGLQMKVNDRPREIENIKTVVILCEASRHQRPRYEETVYFELPAEFRQHALGAEVHIYAFDPMPRSPIEAIGKLAEARYTIWGKLSGLSEKQKVTGITAEWFISPDSPPQVRKALGEHHPAQNPNTQQSWMTAGASVRNEYVYYFTVKSSSWLPNLDIRNSVESSYQHAELVGDLNLIPPEDKPYFRVAGLYPDKREADENEWIARHAAPETGTYILLSPRRAVIT